MSNIGRSLALRLIPLLGALGLLLGAPRTAQALVDLTGSWQVKVLDGTLELVTVYFTFVQSGTDLTLTRNGLGTVMGTIQPGTGEFAFDLGPFTAPDAPPGPNHFITGVGAPDSGSFTGQENMCIFEIGLGWGCLTFNLEGIPGTPPPPVCGNGTVESGEECDRGLSNNDTCCTTSCQLVDQDGDLDCDLLDNCPNTPNADQLDQDNDFFGDACDPSTLGDINGAFTLNTVFTQIKVPSSAASAKKLFVRGSFIGTMAVPETFQIRDIGTMNLDLASLPAWTAKTCKSTATRISCKSPDGTLKVKLKQLAGDPSVRIKIIVKNPPLTPPFRDPVIMALHIGGSGRVEIMTGCVYKPSGSVKCEG